MSKRTCVKMLVPVCLLLMAACLDAQTAGQVCVSQEVNAGVGDFTFLGLANVFNASTQPAAAVYSYNVPDAASYNGTITPSLSNVSQLFLVKTNDGAGSSMFHVHDQPNDGAGGSANTAYTLLGGDTASILVSDDPGETSLNIGGTAFTFTRNWVACCTDGGVIGTLEGAWTMDASFTSAPTGIPTWQVTSAGGGSVPLTIGVNQRARLQNCNDVDLVDLKPGSNPNCVNTGSGGLISVAILSTDTFDATNDVNQNTIVFGGVTPPQRCNFEDVEGDGDLDLVCKFKTQDVSWPIAGSDCGFVQLTADLWGGGSIISGAVACIAGEPTCEAGTPTTP